MAMPPFLVISRRDVADAQDVEVAVLAGEAELAGEVLAHHVAVEERHRAAAQLHQLDQRARWRWSTCRSRRGR